LEEKGGVYVKRWVLVGIIFFSSLGIVIYGVNADMLFFNID